LTSCSEDPQVPVAQGSSTTLEPSGDIEVESLIPTVEDLGNGWNEQSYASPGAYERVLVRCATGRSDVEIEGVGTFFEAKDGGLLFPVAMRLESPREAAEALRQAESNEFTACLDREAAADPTSLFFDTDDARYVRTRRVDVFDFDLTPREKDGPVGVWVSLETEILNPDGSADGPITTGVMLVRQGRHVQLSRWTGLVNQRTTDNASVSLVHLFP
jgi:hypothetical protein